MVDDAGCLDVRGRRIALSVLIQQGLTFDDCVEAFLEHRERQRARGEWPTNTPTVGAGRRQGWI